jgi:hypothetical protein
MRRNDAVQSGSNLLGYLTRQCLQVAANQTPLRMDTGRPEGAEIVLQNLCPSAAGLIAETEIVSFP